MPWSTHPFLHPQNSSIANASKSVPMLLTPSPVSNLGSRRQSTCSITSLGGLDSRRSSAASIGNPLGSYKSHRRPSALISNSSSGNLLQQLSAGVVSTVSIPQTHLHTCVLWCLSWCPVGGSFGLGGISSCTHLLSCLLFVWNVAVSLVFL